MILYFQYFFLLKSVKLMKRCILREVEIKVVFILKISCFLFAR